MRRYTIAWQERCLERGLSSPMYSMLKRAENVAPPQRKAALSVDEVIARILVGNVPDRTKAEETLRKILA